MAEDIFKEPLHAIEGIEDFSKKESQARIKRLKKSERENFCTIKEEKPSWYSPDMKWRQTYSIQRRDKMKIIGKKCLLKCNNGKKNIKSCSAYKVQKSRKEM